MAKKWTPSEEKFLLDNYGKVPMNELAEKFGVTRKAISAKLDKLRAAYGIRPVGAQDRDAEATVVAPAVPKVPPRSTRAVHRAQLQRPIKPPPVEPLDGDAFGPKVPSGLFIKTEEGWKPVLLDKEKISQ
jgi:hypothetical protein